MLALTRKVGQKLLIGNEIEILIREVRGRQVRISIIAPAGLPVMRDELYQMMAEQNVKAAHTASSAAIEALFASVARR